MKIAAIYNVWDGEELLSGSINCIRDHVDQIIIVWQDVSNFGERHSPLEAIMQATEGTSSYCHQYTPIRYTGFQNEVSKRNLGLQLARQCDCTHFLFMDCDEYWEDFAAAKQQYINSGAQGSAAKLFTYFKKPTLRLENEDNYFVPFIHRLNTETVAGVGRYPYYSDPTRKVFCRDVSLLGERMHHFSYVRTDIHRKCRNSSARANIEKSQLLKDYHDPACGPGFYVKDFRQKLVEVPNIFSIQM